MTKITLSYAQSFARTFFALALCVPLFAGTAQAQACSGSADLWFLNDESGSVSADEFTSARTFLSSVANSFNFDQANGFQGSLVSWSGDSQQKFVGVTGLTDDQQANSSNNFSTIVNNYTRSYDSRTSPGAALGFVKPYILNSTDAGGGLTANNRRINVPQVVVMLTDASGLDNIGNDISVFESNAAAIRASGAEIVLMLIGEAACNYSQTPTPSTFATFCSAEGESYDPDFKTKMDAIAGGASNVFVGDTYQSIASPTNGYVSGLSSLVCSTAASIAPPAPELTVVKRKTGENKGADGQWHAGDTLSYAVSIENTGNVELDTVVLTDSLLVGSPVSLTAANVTVTGQVTADSVLEPGEIWTYSYSYTVTQANLDTGYVLNAASVAAKDPSDSTVTGSSDGDGNLATDSPFDADSITSNDPLKTDLSPAGQLTVTKTVSEAALADGATAGDVLVYTITAQNTGNVSLDNISLSDTQTPLGGAGVIQVPSFTSSSDIGLVGAATDTGLASDFLEVGETWTWTLNYTLLQSDIDAGGVANLATITADDPSNTQITAQSSSSGNTTASGSATSTTLTPNGAITGLKTVSLTADADSSGGISAGDTLTYTITATNTGNVTLTGVGVQSDTLSRGTTTLTSVSGFSSSDFTLVSGDSTTLAPNASARFTATYVVTQDDVNAGGLSNTATVVGTPASGGSNVTDITDDGDTGAGDTGADPTLATLQPLAVDDNSYGNVLGAPTTVNVLSNDSYLGATTPIVKLLDGDTSVESLTVSGEGTWTVNNNNTVTFSPDPSFTQDPTPVEYKIESQNVADSNRATVFVDYLGVQTSDELVAKDDELVGQDPSGPVIVDPLDNDANGNTADLDRSTVRLLDANGNRQPNLIVPGEGEWSVNTSTGLVTFTPEGGFSGSNVSATYYVENNDGLPQTAVIKILFIDPRGVVYDNDTLQPISGVELKFADENGNVLPDTCFPAGQQPQTTGSDGRYRFDLAVACTTIAGKQFQILITNSNGYSLTPVADFKQSGPLDPGTPSTDIFEVVAYDAAPTSSQTRLYYMSFLLGVNSSQVVNNHIPLRRLSLEIEDDLRQVLRDDLVATMRQHQRQMAGYAEGALKRLKDNGSTSCSSAISDQLAKSPILFETGSSKILPESDTTLDVIADLLDQCSDMAFEVEGHTDNRGSVLYNDALSRARAKSVVASLVQRGAPPAQLSAKGYGELRPIVANETPEGLAMNRRVVFTALAGQSSQTCQDSSEVERSLDLKINQDGASGDGEFFKESKDCASNSWTIWEGALAYMKTDTGMSQGMLNVTRRKEQLRDQAKLYGYFLGAYGTNNDVSGLATGSIKGFGLTAGAYGAERAANGLFFDYYLGASTGRHNFDLDFERTAGVVSARGHYDYFAAFAGASVSGETSLGDYKLVPRAGLEAAWSPGGEAEYEASRGVIKDVGSLSTGKVTGARMFVELRFDDLTPKQSGQVAITPKIFCDQPLGGGDKLCGAGASIELSSDEVDGQGRYSFGIEGERTHNSHSLGVSFEYAAPVWEGELSTTSTVSSQGSLSLGMNYERQF